MTGNCLARTHINQQDWENGDDTSKEDRGKDMKMDRTGGSDPSERGDPQGHADSRQPLQHHQSSEHAVGTLPDFLRMIFKTFYCNLSQMPGLRFISVR